MYQVVDGKVYHLNEQLGMPENSNLQILVDAWALTIPEEGREDFLKEFNRERLLNRFENGERHISFRYWTRTATFEPMLAEDHMALYREKETGDIIAVNYVLDRTEHYRLKEKEQALEKSNREYAKLLEESVFAIADGYCVINLTKNIVRGSMYQVMDGKVYNLNEQLGMPENSNLHTLVDALSLIHI